MIVTWLFSAIATWYCLSNLDQLHIVRLNISRYGLNTYVTSQSIVWLVAALTAFISGVFLSNIIKINIKHEVDVPFQNAVGRLILIHSLLLLLTTVWIAMSIGQLGGISGFLHSMSVDPLIARDIFRDNKLFKGMRLFYAGMVGTAIYAFAILGYNARRKMLTKMQLIACLYVIITSVILFAFLPAVMSGRIYVFYIFLAGYFAACFIYKGLVWKKYLPIGFVILALVWGMKVFFTSDDFQEIGIFSSSFQNFLFYYLNDMMNAITPLNYDDLPKTYGIETFQFLTEYTFTDSYFKNLLGSNIHFVRALKGGGEFPILTMPYIDFGLYGLIILLVYGWIFGNLFNAALYNQRIGVIYGLVVASVALSNHHVFFSQINFWFILFLIYILNLKAKWA
jgi:oligosaccharide repeat unit polymerase